MLQQKKILRTFPLQGIDILSIAISVPADFLPTTTDITVVFKEFIGDVFSIVIFGYCARVVTFAVPGLALLGEG